MKFIQNFNTTVPLWKNNSCDPWNFNILSYHSCMGTCNRSIFTNLCSTMKTVFIRARSNCVRRLVHYCFIVHSCCKIINHSPFLFSSSTSIQLSSSMLLLSVSSSKCDGLRGWFGVAVFKDCSESASEYVISASESPSKPALSESIRASLKLYFLILVLLSSSSHISIASGPLLWLFPSSGLFSFSWSCGSLVLFLSALALDLWSQVLVSFLNDFTFPSTKTRSAITSPSSSKSLTITFSEVLTGGRL